MTAKQVIELYGARWNIETTFQELRSHLGLETTRGWSRMTVLRMVPCLMILYTMVVLFYDQIRVIRKTNGLRIAWEGKNHVTFSDMIANVRSYLWLEWVFTQAPGGEGVRKLSRPVKRLIQYGLTHAA